MLQAVVILADESAHWKIAGLRQLERLALEVNAIAARHETKVPVCIVWPPDYLPERRFRPRHPQLTHVEVVTNEPDFADLLLSTRIFLLRPGSRELESWLKPHPIRSRTYAQLVADVRTARQSSSQTDTCEYLENRAQIAGCEKRFLRRSGKTQDGLVSRYINRPISRALSRVL